MSKKAKKLLNKMKQSPSGWHSHDFHTLYLGYGFTMIEGKNHTTFIHPDFPSLIEQIPRHPGELSKAYAKDAIENIDMLEKLREEKKDKTDE